MECKCSLLLRSRPGTTVGGTTVHCGSTIESGSRSSSGSRASGAASGVRRDVSRALLTVEAIGPLRLSVLRVVQRELSHVDLVCHDVIGGFVGKVC